MNWDGLTTGLERYDSALRYFKCRADEMHGMHLGGQAVNFSGTGPTPMQVGSMEQQLGDGSPVPEGEAIAAEQQLLAMAQETGSEQLLLAAQRFVQGRRPGGKGLNGGRGGDRRKGAGKGGEQVSPDQPPGLPPRTNPPEKFAGTCY